MTDLAPYFDDVQSHYDLSDDFFALFLDDSRTYSCAYFAGDDFSLAEAQQAKINLSLEKCRLEPGMRLLDIGCGWGATMMRAVEGYDVQVTGLTLSRNQHDHVARLLAARPNAHGSEVRLQGWEEFNEPVDRIVSIGAFEHFRYERHAAFFDRCREILPADGRMLLHTIVINERDVIRAKGLKLDRKFFEFGRFIVTQIFPGGELPTPSRVVKLAEAAGFDVERIHPLQLHYARTLDHWADALRERKEEAIRIASEDTFDTYMRYLTGCAELFREGYIDVMQFSLAVAD
ncbi:cyclopropane mycolic acid synthase family methyltransferase [Smaragdicoccus niigatensis]|uniref:cyclopropane mycolic acid synthase family methyltransferase n=1 Tax=Smaragdicoccus niigatensis TaxID=359359 RepID=UPI00035C971A|nr:cyclopropane mycolic acid synthase family methyltransferase [Smaragdicoccus niigatensis]